MSTARLRSVLDTRCVARSTYGMAIETGDRVTVHFHRPGGAYEESVTGRLTNNRLGWLTVQPDDGEPIIVQRGRYKTDAGIWLDWIERAR